MRRTKKILTEKNKFILYKKLKNYLKEVLDEEESYSTFEDLYQEALRVEVYGGRHLTPALIAEWLRGLPVGTEYVTYKICIMILRFLDLDESYAGKLGDGDSIYVESQTDIDGYYWKTLGDIVYQQHLKSLYKAGKPAEV